LATWIAVALAVVIAAIVRLQAPEPEPVVVTVVDTGGEARSISLRDLVSLPGVTRQGVYQNQFGNWRDEGIYSGTFLSALIGTEAEYRAAAVIAIDGYRVLLERERIEDVAYPVVLAYAFDGVEIPAWADGPRVAVLPEDGAVSNAEYGADSAGSFWVKNVIEIRLLR
jgi:hypothetical protein